jgi:hypothetical protein
MTTTSKQSFVFCVFCHHESHNDDDRLVSWISHGPANRVYKWTRCEYCNIQYRQRYNTYFHIFTEPDVQWNIR